MTTSGVIISLGVACDTHNNVFLGGGISGVGDIDPGPGYNMVTARGIRDLFFMKDNSDGELILEELPEPVEVFF
ncbi:MAG TPA: hypothetical protein VGB30_10090 [bacterium]|jgi:hypothetical protein